MKANIPGKSSAVRESFKDVGILLARNPLTTKCAIVNGYFEKIDDKVIILCRYDFAKFPNQNKTIKLKNTQIYLCHIITITNSCIFLEHYGVYIKCKVLTMCKSTVCTISNW